MPTDEMKELAEELRQFQTEKEKIRTIVGQIGGATCRKRERIITSTFVVLLFLLFAADLCRHILSISVPLPPLFSIEIGVLLVSIKIIWMISSQSRVEHFQFWILNSIEFRIDQMSKRMRHIETNLQEIRDGEQAG